MPTARSTRSRSFRTERRGFPAFLQSPLTDSSRRPPPYHALRSGCGGLPPVADRPISAGFGPAPFATGCHRLRPLGSINAPYLLAELLWEHVFPAPTSTCLRHEPFAVERGSTRRSAMTPSTSSRTPSIVTAPQRRQNDARASGTLTAEDSPQLSHTCRSSSLTKRGSRRCGVATVETPQEPGDDEHRYPVRAARPI
jgi:hypothetical protein